MCLRGVSHIPKAIPQAILMYRDEVEYMRPMYSRQKDLLNNSLCMYQF